jgi:tRNA(adenine34) deaminase
MDNSEIEMSNFENLMRAALAEAQKALDLDEVPIGAIVAAAGRIVAAGFNQPISSADPTAHAEIVALRAAASAIGNYRLGGSVLCVTLEPCAMCVGALMHARIATLVFGAAEPKTGAVQSTMRLIEHPSWNHRIDVVSGVLESECREIVQRFFREKRGQR